MIRVWGLTDIGLVRKDNQDAYATAYFTESGHTVAVVCDGMGGVKGGRLASSIAVETFLAETKKVLRAGMTALQLAQASSYAVAIANDAVYEKAQEAKEYHGMGTTLVSAICYEKGAVISNVGDSRAYHITAEGIRRVTEDHSLVEVLVRRGDITEEEARVHPNRNVITRALGPEKSEECDVGQEDLEGSKNKEGKNKGQRGKQRSGQTGPERTLFLPKIPEFFLGKDFFLFLLAGFFLFWNRGF